MEQPNPNEAIRAPQLQFSFRKICLGIWRATTELYEWFASRSPTETHPLFIHGHLTNETLRERLLGLDEDDTLKSEDTFICGYVEKMWGQYPTLVATHNPDDFVHGKVLLGDKDLIRRLRQQGMKGGHLEFVAVHPRGGNTPGLSNPLLEHAMAYVWGGHPDDLQD